MEQNVQLWKFASSKWLELPVCKVFLDLCSHCPPQNAACDTRERCNLQRHHSLAVCTGRALHLSEYTFFSFCVCSAGVGRTGVFITLSIVLERMRYEGVVDIFQTVKMLRTQRPAMVQTEVRSHRVTQNNIHCSLFG